MKNECNIPGVTMFKNILIIGPGRAGKTTLSKMIHRKYGYSIISIDDIVTSLAAFPALNISWDGDHVRIAEQMSGFLANYLKELSEGNKFYDGCKTVIEGTDIDFERLLPDIDRSKYLLIGLTYNQRSKEDLFRTIRKYDTEDDWSYYLSDEQLEKYCEDYIERNQFFNEKFKEYHILSYDTSMDREKVLTEIVDHLEDKCKWEEKTIKCSGGVMQ